MCVWECLLRSPKWFQKGLVLVLRRVLGQVVRCWIDPQLFNGLKKKSRGRESPSTFGRKLLVNNSLFLVYYLLRQNRMCQNNLVQIQLSNSYTTLKEEQTVILQKIEKNCVDTNKEKLKNHNSKTKNFKLSRHITIQIGSFFKTLFKRTIHREIKF